MKNKEELTKTKKDQPTLSPDKNNPFSKGGNKSQDKDKRKDATTIEAERTKSMEQDSKKGKPFLKK